MRFLIHPLFLKLPELLALPAPLAPPARPACYLSCASRAGGAGSAKRCRNSGVPLMQKKAMDNPVQEVVFNKRRRLRQGG
jgi:hypothetical protein